MCHSVCVYNSDRTLQVETGEMVTQHRTLSVLVVAFVCLSCVNCTQQRESFTEIQCESSRPTNCSLEVPDNCPTHKVQRWLPQSSVGVPAACGACYYCQISAASVERDECPLQVCPVISPLCNEVQPVLVEHNGRRCRGCSECVSYNSCPPLKCKKRIRGCAVYAPNYRYVDGELCPDCRVCSRYKGQISRPPTTPLPCPEFNISTCPLVNKCEKYTERYLYMGEGRRCQVCPECLVWKDPNSRIPSSTLNSQGSTQDMARCDEKKCTLPSNCAEAEAVHRLVNGTTCRDCDRCTLFNQRGAADGGNDAMLHQACPDLSRCRQVLLCDEMPSNKTIRIVTDEICKGCAVCRTRQPYCPVIRCPGFWCKKTAMFPTSVNGIDCDTCVCIDDNQDCSHLTCPQTNCSNTVPGLVVIGSHMCNCPVCSDSPIRKQADGGSDSTTPQEEIVAGPDMRNAREEKTTLAMFSSTISISSPTTTTTATTTDISTATHTPNCDAVVPGWQCPTLDCVLVNIDLLTVDGLKCYGCPRCTNDLGEKPSCPTILCASVNCGDSEDIASGRKYREKGYYNVSGVMCEGCDKCLDCPPIKCEPLHPECLRYTRRTDRRGCVLCPYCEVWRNNHGPPLPGNSGFIQSVSTAKCIQSNGNLTNTEPGLITNVCEFDKLLPGSQVWTFSNSGLLQERGTGMCVSYYIEERPLVMRLCNSANPNMLWSLQKHNTYPQFFRIKHGRTTKCLDILPNSSQAMGLATCEPFGRENGVWSRQWWKYEEHAQSGVAMTTQ